MSLNSDILSGYVLFILLLSLAVFSIPAHADTVPFEIGPEQDVPGLKNSSLSVRDFNQKGGPDVAVIGEKSNGSKRFLVQYITENIFPSALEDPMGSNGLSSGDLDSINLNGNNYPDLTASGINQSDSPDFRTFFNETSSETFSSDPTLKNALGGIQDGSHAWAEATGDTLSDFAVTGRTGTDSPIFTLLQQDGPNSFSTLTENFSTLIDSGLWRSDVAWGQFDSDTFPDLAVMGKDSSGTKHLIVLRNLKGQGEFTDNFPLGKQGEAGLSRGEVTWKDYDNDGDSDLVAMGIDRDSTPRFLFFENNTAEDGLGNLELDNSIGDSNGQPLGQNNGYYHSSMAWGDPNNDGYPDLAVMGSTNQDTVLHLYINDGDGTFSDTQSLLSDTGFQYGDLAWGDFDSNGGQDLVVTGSDQNNEPRFMILVNQKAFDESDDSNGSDVSNSSDECIIERSNWLNSQEPLLRSTRDSLLQTPYGRWFTHWYYGM